MTFRLPKKNTISKCAKMIMMTMNVKLFLNPLPVKRKQEWWTNNSIGRRRGAFSSPLRCQKFQARPSRMCCMLLGDLAEI